MTTDRQYVCSQARGLLSRVLGTISIVLILIPWGAVAQDQLQGWTTRSEANAMQLIAVRQSGSITEFVLKNVSTAVITAFTITHGGVGHTIDYFQSDGNLPPGATYSLKVANEEVAGRERTLNIACVIFEDGSAQGARDEIDFIRGRRLGRLFETERIRALLDAQVDTLPVQAGLEAFAAKLGGLPASRAEAIDSVDNVRVPEATIGDIRSAKPKLADGFLLGVRNARQDALWKVEQYLRTLNSGRVPPTRSTPTLSELRQLYRALSSKYHAQLLTPKDGRR